MNGLQGMKGFSPPSRVGVCSQELPSHTYTPFITLHAAGVRDAQWMSEGRPAFSIRTTTRRRGLSMNSNIPGTPGNALIHPATTLTTPTGPGEVARLQASISVSGASSTPPATLTEQGAESLAGVPIPSLVEEGALQLTSTTPHPVAKSVSGKPPATLSRTAALIAELQNQNVTAVEAALVGVRQAYQSGNTAVIEGALIEQAALLQALGEKLLKVAGDQKLLPAVNTYTTLSLRAMDNARKTLATLAALRGGLKTNVQVNVGGPGTTNEILEVPGE